HEQEGRDRVPKAVIVVPALGHDVCLGRKDRSLQTRPQGEGSGGRLHLLQHLFGILPPCPLCQLIKTVKFLSFSRRESQVTWHFPLGETVFPACRTGIPRYCACA